MGDIGRAIHTLVGERAVLFAKASFLRGLGILKAHKPASHIKGAEGARAPCVLPLPKGLEENRIEGLSRWNGSLPETALTNVYGGGATRVFAYTAHTAWRW
jgi:hypothetical protein